MNFKRCVLGQYFLVCNMHFLYVKLKYKNICYSSLGFFFFLGLLTVVKSSQTANMSARPGDNVTIWCQHTAGPAEYIHWFKQTNSDVPIIIVYVMITHQLKELQIKYLNGFQPDRLVMSLNTENTSLRILNVDISDSGLYYCGWDSWGITFGNGTHLDIKGNLSLSIPL